jgi:hypothetical protein
MSHLVKYDLRFTRLLSMNVAVYQCALRYNPEDSRRHISLFLKLYFIKFLTSVFI